MVGGPPRVFVLFWENFGFSAKKQWVPELIDIFPEPASGKCWISGFEDILRDLDGFKSLLDASGVY